MRSKVGKQQRKKTLISKEEHLEAGLAVHFLCTGGDGADIAVEHRRVDPLAVELERLLDGCRTAVSRTAAEALLVP